MQKAESSTWDCDGPSSRCRVQSNVRAQGGGKLELEEEEIG